MQTAISAIVAGAMIVSAPIMANATDKSKINGFVTRFYESCLNRKPDQQGLNYWSDGLSSDRLSGTDIAKNFVNSEELRNKKLSNDAYLDTLYAGLMGRKADAGGKTYWLNIIRGGTDRDAVLSHFLHSPEFSNICSHYGIRRDAKPSGHHNGNHHNQTKPASTQQTGNYIGVARAIEIAIAKIPGAKAVNARDVKLDRDDGIYVYEGEIIYNNYEYEFEIDAISGAIRSWDVDSVFD